MDCKSVLGCVPLLGFGIGTQRVYNEYLKAKDLKVKGSANSIFSLMNKKEIVHGACEFFIPVAGPLLYGGCRLLYVTAQKVYGAWKRLRQNKNDLNQTSALPAPVFPPQITLQVTDLSTLATLTNEYLNENLIGQPISFKTTDASIDRPCLSLDQGRDKERIEQIARQFPKNKNEIDIDYQQRLLKRLHRQNAAQARSTEATVSTPVTQEYSGILLKVGKRSKLSGRYKLKIKLEGSRYYSFRAADAPLPPYGYGRKKTLSFYVSDAELQKFNSSQQQIVQ